jgi:hypothetical protein
MPNNKTERARAEVHFFNENAAAADDRKVAQTRLLASMVEVLISIEERLQRVEQLLEGQTK